MTRELALGDLEIERIRPEARNIWQVAKVQSGRIVPAKPWTPRTGVQQNLMPEAGADDDRCAVLVGWPRIFPGI